MKPAFETEFATLEYFFTPDQDYPNAQLAFQYIWGSNSAILANAQILGSAYDLTGAAEYRDGVVRTMDYILGRNALNISYVTGYGDVYAKNQHSRMYANQNDPSLPNPPAGTISGGPNSTAVATGDPIAQGLWPDGCAAQFCYIDDIGSWSTNELTINWNAPMSWVASFLADQDNGSATAMSTATAELVQSQWNSKGRFVGRLVITNPLPRTAQTKAGIAVDEVTFAVPTDLVLSTKQKDVTITRNGAWVTVTTPYYKNRVYPRSMFSISVTGDSALGSSLAHSLPEQYWLDGKPA